VLRARCCGVRKTTKRFPQNMLMIIKWLVIFPMIPLNFQVIGFKLVSRITRDGAARKSGDPKNEGKSLEVIENKCRKNVSLYSC